MITERDIQEMHDTIHSWLKRAKEDAEFYEVFNRAFVPMLLVGLMRIKYGLDPLEIITDEQLERFKGGLICRT